jgi:hypothetical protein
MRATALSEGRLGCTRWNLPKDLNTAPSEIRAVSIHA